jgi:amidase
LYGNFAFFDIPFVLTPSYQWYIDDPEIFKDAPICIQVIGKTLEEEAVIAIGEIVDSALKTKIASSKL